MTDELHPLRGGSPVRVAERSLPCRFRHEDHNHHVQVYPETRMYQVKWQHSVPPRPGYSALDLAPPALVFEAETCWYTLHSLPPGDFRPAWETLRNGDWMPFEGVRGMA